MHRESLENQTYSAVSSPTVNCCTFDMENYHEYTMYTLQGTCIHVLMRDEKEKERSKQGPTNNTATQGSHFS